MRMMKQTDHDEEASLLSRVSSKFHNTSKHRETLPGLVPGSSVRCEVPDECEPLQIGTHFLFENRQKQREEAIEYARRNFDIWKSGYHTDDAVRDSECVFVAGAPGTGKTTFCRKLFPIACETLPDKGTSFYSPSPCLANNVRANVFMVFLSLRCFNIQSLIRMT